MRRILRQIRTCQTLLEDIWDIHKILKEKSALISNSILALISNRETCLGLNEYEELKV